MLYLCSVCLAKSWPQSYTVSYLNRVHRSIVLRDIFVTEKLLFTFMAYDRIPNDLFKVRALCDLSVCDYRHVLAAQCTGLKIWKLLYQVQVLLFKNNHEESGSYLFYYSYIIRQEFFGKSLGPKIV